MYKNRTICVVVPAFNEARQIAKVIDTMPDYIDQVVIVDDGSKDATSEKVRQYQKENN